MYAFGISMIRDNISADGKLGRKEGGGQGREQTLCVYISKISTDVVNVWVLPEKASALEF